MRLIDADKLIKALAHMWYDSPISISGISVSELINAQPTIEIVRCNECEFSKVYQNDSSGVMGRFCEAFTQLRMVSDDDFCSCGERREP